MTLLIQLLCVFGNCGCHQMLVSKDNVSGASYLGTGYSCFILAHRLQIVSAYAKWRGVTFRSALLRMCPHIHFTIHARRQIILATKDE